MNLINLDSDNTDALAKQYITIIYEDKESRVSWYVDTPIEDARFSVICACDALVDSEFEVLDDKAKIINFNSITNFKNGSIYFLRKKKSGKPTNILLDGRRKLYVEIDPLRHIESQQAIKYMIIGSNLLKHTKKGYPHIRLFQISSDLKRILWYTKSKKINESQISIDSIEDLSIGQTSENFIRYPLKMLEDFSFTIYYKNKNSNNLLTLDLTCKDAREFDLWIIGIKALHALFTCKIICKNDLLSHSKSYKEQIENGNIGTCTRFLFYNASSSGSVNDTRRLTEKTLEKFIVSRNLGQFEISKLFLKLAFKIKAMRNEVENLSQVDEYKTGIKEQGYDMIFAEEAIVDDLDTQKNQMIILFKQCEKNLAIILKEFLWYSNEQKMKSQFNIHEDDHDEFFKTLSDLENQLYANLPNFDEFNPEKINTEFFLKEIDIQLWKIEIDLENVGDIINRFKTPHNSGILDSIKNFFKNLNK
jgi:hypothetical protein